MSENKYREALVNIANILGAPIPCPGQHCEGCQYEHLEAAREALIALDYLKPPKYKYSHSTTNRAGGECKHYVFDGPQPDPLQAWEKFMKQELDVELSPEWRENIKKPQENNDHQP